MFTTVQKQHHFPAVPLGTLWLENNQYGDFTTGENRRESILPSWVLFFPALVLSVRCGNRNFVLKCALRKK